MPYLFSNRDETLVVGSVRGMAFKWSGYCRSSSVSLPDMLYLGNELLQWERTLVVGSDKAMSFRQSNPHPFSSIFFSFFIYISETEWFRDKMHLLVVVINGHSNDSGFALQQTSFSGLHSGFALHWATKTKENSKRSMLQQLLESHPFTNTKDKFPSWYGNPQDIW